MEMLWQMGLRESLFYRALHMEMLWQTVYQNGSSSIDEAFSQS
jgi:hypothetical protein